MGHSGNVVSNFVMTNYVSNGTNVSHGNAVLDVPRQTNAVAFAWWKTGNHLVEAKCKLMGKDLTAKFRFIVDEPAIPVFVNPAVPPRSAHSSTAKSEWARRTRTPLA